MSPARARRTERGQPPIGSSAAAEFFEQLTNGVHDPRLGNARGSIRFDVVDGKRTNRWLLTVDRGDVRLSRGNANASVDAVVRSDRATFERALSGELNLMAAVLRGEVTLQGDLRLLVLLQRLFPRVSRGSASARTGA